jgi:hypothetical protein
MGKEFFDQFDAGLPGGAGEVPIDNPFSTTRITETAYRLNVLSLLVSEPTVNEYLGAHNELSDIEHTMTQAQETLLTQEDMSISPGVARRLQANYRQALGFNHTVLLVIEDGLHVRSVEETITEMETCLTPVLSPMGMYLDEWKPGYQSQVNGIRLRGDEETNRAQRAKEEEEDANLRSELVRPTQAGFIPTKNWQHSQEIHAYAALMTAVVDAERHLFQAGARSITEETHQEGMKIIKDNDRQRFGLVRGMVYAMEASLNEGIIAIGNNDKHTPPYQYASYLNQFLWAYGREIV